MCEIVRPALLSFSIRDTSIFELSDKMGASQVQPGNRVMCLQFRFHLVLVLLLLTGIGARADEETPAPKSRPSRLELASSRSVSPMAKSSKPSDKAEATDLHDEAQSKPPSRVPSLDEMILFQPNRKGDWAPSRLKYSDVEFESNDGTALHAWYCPADAPRAVVLYCHGNGGNISWMADYFEFLRAEHRLTLLAFDYRGYGKSQGTPTVEGVLADGRAAREKLSELAGVPSDEIVVWGRSMGGAVAVQLASEEPPRGLILECTFDSFKTVAKHHAPRWAFLVPEDRLASVKRIPEVRCPLFQVHGTADRVVPFECGQTLYQAAHEPKFFLTVRGADHNTPAPLKMFDTIDRFLDLKCPQPARP